MSIEEFLRTQRLGPRGNRTQPFILQLGEKTYVIVDELAIPAVSLVKGVDLCFKIIHILNVEYPPMAKNVWLFLQKALYKIELQESIPNCVRDLEKNIRV